MPIMFHPVDRAIFDLWKIHPSKRSNVLRFYYFKTKKTEDGLSPKENNNNANTHTKMLRGGWVGLRAGLD
jgi:hypothetical protein